MNPPRKYSRRLFIAGAHAFVLLAFVQCKQSPEPMEKAVSGLESSVEVVRDSFGLNHIYAQSEHDLFFAQGYLAARDRLFQFEIWRRQATGTVAEILGEKELKRDIGTRLFKYRGDLREEFDYYHENGYEIITAYTDGVNAYIQEVREHPDLLPFEFGVLGILPELWTPEVVISRHQGLLGNIEDELAIGRAVAAIGEEAVREVLWFHPKSPDLTLHGKIDSDALEADILELYNAYRQSVKFEEADLAVYNGPSLADSLSLGSNNWVVEASRMANGLPFMANDPHRRIAVPSLRYMAHLVAPGWDVIGGGEPEIPGISIGHNQHGAWGLTVYSTDGEDLMVYKTNPEAPDEYFYQGQWVAMEVIEEEIPVKGKDPVPVSLKYSRHGPVVYQDSVRNLAYAVRCAWMEPGGSPYLASLRMDQARTWEEFRDACSYSHIPGENMIWADTSGVIGWQAVGIAPIRRNYSGLVPVPGDGRFEWEGYLPIPQKPHIENPASGYIATANQNVTPEDYTHWDAIGFEWSDPFRGDRIEEVLEGEGPFSMEEMMALQVDVTSLPARELTPYLMDLEVAGQAVAARDVLKTWDYRLEPNSVAAAIYVNFENTLRRSAWEAFMPEKAKPYLSSIQLERILQWIREPGSRFGSVAARDAFLVDCFQRSVADLSQRLGADMGSWQYGQENLKHTFMEHPLSSLISQEERTKTDLGPLPRGGNGYTPGSTGNNYQQTSGASFRMLVPVGDWDRTLGTNSPGQSGDPESPFYDNLFEPWAEDQYFPMPYSRDSVLKYAYEKELLIPGNL
ncbi:penicillin amidase [Robiginitalea myxolifaciens]|uniref:Penicillin amidase n=1 Tax=Robiginitalea myxolifaciens TaxID=400055 RepID=A0A1I6FY70_9FLAO|nr:penicillin acylase family protein [Robiginitalea myxolifaciens]SFR34866.1 penicillin amidase [Robiginitalea myxolifaciens]